MDGEAVEVGIVGDNKEREIVAGKSRSILHRKIGDLLRGHTQRHLVVD
jgi:hypothetical protein